MLEDERDTQAILKFSQDLVYKHPITKFSKSVDSTINEADFPDYDEEEIYDFSDSVHGNLVKTLLLF